jgi:hypothetical protein
MKRPGYETLIKATAGISIKRRSRMVYDQVAADFLQVDLHQHPLPLQWSPSAKKTAVVGRMTVAVHSQLGNQSADHHQGLQRRVIGRGE